MLKSGKEKVGKLRHKRTKKTRLSKSTKILEKLRL